MIKWRAVYHDADGNLYLAPVGDDFDGTVLALGPEGENEGSWVEASPSLVLVGEYYYNA